MEQYYELDKKIVNCYTQMLETDQVADDATSEAYTTNKDSI